MLILASVSLKGVLIYLVTQREGQRLAVRTPV